MKFPITFLTYSISSYLTIEYIVPTIAVLIILGLTFAFYWCVIRHLPKTLKQEYQLLLEDVKKAHKKKRGIHLCILATKRSKILEIDLRDRLRVLDKTDPDLFTYYSENPSITSEQLACSKSAFWKNTDVASRIEFLERVIRRVR